MKSRGATANYLLHWFERAMDYYTGMSDTIQKERICSFNVRANATEIIIKIHIDSLSIFR